MNPSFRVNFRKQAVMSRLANLNYSFFTRFFLKTHGKDTSGTRNFGHTVPEPIYFGNANGIYLTNKPGLELLGLDNPGQLSGPVSDLLQKLSLHDPVTQEAMPSEESPFFIALSGKKVCKEVLVKNQKTEQDLFLRVSAAPVLRDQKIVAVIAVGIDITEYRKAERLLKEAA